MSRKLLITRILATVFFTVCGSVLGLLSTIPVLDAFGIVITPDSRYDDPLLILGTGIIFGGLVGLVLSWFAMKYLYFATHAQARLKP